MKVNFQILNSFFVNKNQNAKKILKGNAYQNNLGIINPFVQNTIDTFEISFKGADSCNPKDFQVKRLENLRCPVCGLIMLSEEQVALFCKDVSQKKGEALICALSKYKDESVLTGKPSQDKSGCGIYRPIKKEIVDTYIELANQYPDKDLLGLTNIQAEKCINELIEKQLAVVEEFKDFIEKNITNENEKSRLEEHLKTFTESIKGKNSERFSRKKFTRVLSYHVQDDELKKEANAILNKMPTSENDVVSFFVKHAESKSDIKQELGKKKPSSERIAESLVRQAVATTEHLVPKNKQGSNKLSNYICDCAHCNSKKGDMDFYDWFQTIPDFKEKLQNYLNEVRNALDNEELDVEYDTYIDKVVETISRISKGELILEIPDVQNPKKRIVVLEKRKREIEQVKEHNKKLLEIKNQLEEEIKKLEEYKHFDDIERLYEFSLKIREIDTQINDIKKEIRDLEIKRQKARKIVENKKASKNSYKKNLQILEQCSEEIENKQEQIRKLELKKVSKKEQINNISDRESIVAQQIETLRILMRSINQYTTKIAGLGNYKQEEEKAKKALEDIIVQLAQLKQENETILQKEGFDPNNSSEYKEYIYQKTLAHTAEHLLTNKTYKRQELQYRLQREVIELGKNAIETKLEELKQKDSVKYFINLNKIKHKENLKNTLEENLINAQKNTKEALAAKIAIEELLQGRKIEEIEKEFAILIEEKSTIQDIKTIAEKRARLDKATKILRKNIMQLEKLANYEDMKNSEYFYIMSFVDIDTFR